MNKKYSGLSWLKKIKKVFAENRLQAAGVSVILVLAIFVRIYRVGDLLGFYYDQGRDALVIWNLWHNGKLFLTGPVTGLAGIFLGPFYYYLIAPFYLIGGGDPRVPAVFLSLLSVLALFMLFLLASRMHSGKAGFIALVIGSFSYFIVQAGRWLSNPTPILLLSVIVLWLMWNIITGTKKSNNINWILLSLALGISLQLESASAVFYLPVAFVFALWQRKKLPQVKIIVISGMVFLATLLPQILFNLRHDNLILKSFERVLVGEKSFRSPFNLENYNFKKEYFWNVFNSKIFPGHVKYSGLFYLASLTGLLLFWRENKNVLKLLLIFLGVPVIGYIFFQGNEGHIYDYYMTGYYMPLILLFSLGLASIWKYLPGKIVVLIFFISFLRLNLELNKNFLNSDINNMVTLGTERAAVDWVFGNSRGRGEFNVDIYVPPVIPHSYEYLLLWRGTKFCGDSLCGLTKDKNVDLLYTIFEEDPPHPYRLKSWLENENNGSVIEEQIRFGLVSAQRRTRIK